MEWMTNALLMVDVVICLLLLGQISEVALSWQKIFVLTGMVFLLKTLLLQDVFLLLEPFLLFIFVAVFQRSWTWDKKVFYGFFPFVMSDVFGRIIGIYLRFLLHVDQDILIDNTMFHFLQSIILFPLYFFILKGLRMDAEHLKKWMRNERLKVVYASLNALFVLYAVFIRPSMVFEGRSFGLMPFPEAVRLRVVLVHFVLLVVTVLYLNYRIKEQEETIIQKLQHQQIVEISRYSKHVESLYQEIKSFRHDYTNLLASLNESIKNDDIESIRRIYEAVLDGTDKQFHHSKYDIADLSNIKEEAVKGLLSSKLMEAQNKGVSISVEVEDAISAPPMELIDFITMLSILLDNAIEAAEQVRGGDILFAYFEEDAQKILIVDNAISTYRVDVSQIFKYGYSEKGDDRGIGLSNINKLLLDYPEISLSTTSKAYRFTQEIRFMKG